MQTVLIFDHFVSYVKLVLFFNIPTIVFSILLLFLYFTKNFHYNSQNSDFSPLLTFSFITVTLYFIQQTLKIPLLKSEHCFCSGILTPRSLISGFFIGGRKQAFDHTRTAGSPPLSPVTTPQILHQFDPVTDGDVGVHGVHRLLVVKMVLHKQHMVSDSASASLSGIPSACPSSVPESGLPDFPTSDTPRFRKIQLL